MLVVRAARRDDIDAFVDLAAGAGTGFTSLALSRDDLAERLDKSANAYESEAVEPGEEVYQLMLEDTESGHVVGCAAVKAAVGLSKPYYDFKIVTLAQSSRAAQRRFDMDVMILVNDFAGCSEVGSLYVSDAARGTGAGRLIAQTRYLLMAADYRRFGERVLAELRGVVREDGSSPFFDAVTRHFFRMSFDEADRMSAASDNQFILDLMPKHPIYVDLLSPEAKKVIGVTHELGVGARRLLEWEGFTYDRYIDIFDGGPLMSVQTRQARSARESRQVKVRAARAFDDPKPVIVTTDRFSDFRSLQTQADVSADRVALGPEDMRALNLTEGERARIWVRE
jgi:arginine N-succinyltransferase